MPSNVLVRGIDPIYDTRDTTDFKHHLINTTVDPPVRDVTSSRYFWNVHMLGAYEWKPGQDNDANDEPKPIAGWSAHEANEGSTNFVFVETARDIHAEPQWAGMVDLSTLLDRISAHEALHRFFGWHAADGEVPGAADEGIMNAQECATAITLSLTNRQIQEIQRKEHP